MRSFFLLCMATFLAIALGAYGARETIATFDGFDRLQIGDWIAHPKNGGQQIGIFARARLAHTGQIPLGSAEGIRFVAQVDSQGNALQSNCDYQLIGNVPPARLWTLYSADLKYRVFNGARGFRGQLHSRGLIRHSRTSITIEASARPHGTNWLWTGTSDGDGFVLIMTLYDTTIASASGASTPQMPMIVKGACAGV